MEPNDVTDWSAGFGTSNPYDWGNIGNWFNMSTGNGTGGTNTGWFGNLNNSIAQNQSAINFGMGALQGLAGAWNTWNTNKLQKEALNFQRQQYDTNLALTKKTTNNALADRQMRRVSANPNAESVESYMSKWGV